MLELRLRIAAAVWPDLEALLDDLGALAVTRSEGDSAVFDEPGLGAAEQWGQFAVEALFAAEVDVSALRNAITAHCGAVEIATRSVPEQDWQDTWKQDWQAQLFAGGLCICPSWLEPPAAARHVIRLDPGQAFGTGTHPSTALCLDWLGVCTSISHARVIDYGCGSGVLALAAAALGAQAVSAVDIDAAALEVARENIARNQGAVPIEVVLPGTVTIAQADILLANILLEPLLALADDFARLLRPDGQIVLAGLLATQVDQAAAVYARYFDLEAPTERGEWARLCGRLRSAA